jgi:Flp pilus assembly protein TadD
MKKQISCILFSLVTTVAACGGDRSSPEATREGFVPPAEAPPAEAPPAEAMTSPQPGFGSGAPVADKPAAIEDPRAAPPKVTAKVEDKVDARAAELKRTREQLLAAAKADKKSATPHIELARSYIATGERALALKHANKAVKLAPTSSLAQNTLGRAELLRHDYDAAILAFREAATLDPGNVWAWNNLGLVYMTQQNYQDAVAALVEATSRKGALGYMWNNLGLAYEQLDQLDEAREAFEHGAKLGSVAAKASRKRLEGVDTIALVKPKKLEETVKANEGKDGFEAREPMPEVPPVPDDEPKVEEPEVIDSVEIQHGDGDVVPDKVEAAPVEEKPAPPTSL